MPNDEIVTKIEELKKICDPNESEATLVHELRRVNEEIANIQNEISELKSIPDALYYDEIQESRDLTRKAELQKQVRELQNQASILEIELKELKSREEVQNRALKKVQQDKNENATTISVIKEYESTLESPDAKENMTTILKEVDRKVKEDTEVFQKKATEYQALQQVIEKKAELIDSVTSKIAENQRQLEQISTDLSNGDKYINQDKKKKDSDKITELEKRLEELTERQAEIVSNPIMMVSLANKAALDGDLVTILNKIKGVKESLLQKPFMDIPEDSIQEQTAKAIEDRNTFYNQINGKDYTLKGLPAADERIDELNAYIAKWLEEVNTLKARKDEIDNGTKYGSARKIIETSEMIKVHTEEVRNYETKESLTDDEEVALDKRKKEIEALKKVLNSYFADQNANIKEAENIGENIKILENRIEFSKAEIKDLRKMSKSLAGIDIMSKKKDSDKLQEYVNTVMDLKKLPEYRRMLGIVDEILETLGKDIVVPPIEEKEDNLVLGEEQQMTTETEKTVEIHPIEDVKADEIKIEPAIVDTNENIIFDENAEKTKFDSVSDIKEPTSNVVFEPAFKEEVNQADIRAKIDQELNAAIDRNINTTPNKVVASEDISQKAPLQEISNPFANINDLKTVEPKTEVIPEVEVHSQVEAASQIATPSQPVKVESQEKVVAFPAKETTSVTSIDTSQVLEEQSIPQQPIEQPSTSSIDDFFAQQWGEVSNEEVQTLGRVA